jgi:hypothetical protein
MAVVVLLGDMDLTLFQVRVSRHWRHAVTSRAGKAAQGLGVVSLDVSKRVVGQTPVRTLVLLETAPLSRGSRAHQSFGLQPYAPRSTMVVT